MTLDNRTPFDFGFINRVLSFAIEGTGTQDAEWVVKMLPTTFDPVQDIIGEASHEGRKAFVGVHESFGGLDGMIEELIDTGAHEAHHLVQQRNLRANREGETKTARYGSPGPRVSVEPLELDPEAEARVRRIADEVARQVGEAMESDARAVGHARLEDWRALAEFERRAIIEGEDFEPPVSWL
jgi:hypothetical protein